MTTNGIRTGNRVRVWGLAAGRGSTTGAAVGAFTSREYPNMDAAKRAVAAGDWLDLLGCEEVK